MAHISLQMYTLRDFVKTPEAVRETYRKVADIGYRYVQPIRPGFMEPEAFAALLRSFSEVRENRHVNDTDFSYAWYMYGDIGNLSYSFDVHSSLVVRPALNLNLNQIEFSIVS